MAIQQTSSEWARIANTTLTNYIRQETDCIMRSRKVFAMLQKRGRIKYNQSGDGFTWPIRFKRAQVQVNDLETPPDFPRTNRWKNAFLDMAGYVVTNAMTMREKLKNKSGEAIINVFKDLAPAIRDDIEDAMTEEVYVDNSAASNSGRCAGLESMFGATQTITVSSGAARTANPADPCGYPDDTYAGLDTDLAAHGGSWGTQSGIDSTWPFGRGRPEFDCWTPVIVNYTSTAFDGSSSTWAANCVRATRFGIEAVNGRNKASQGQVDMVLLDHGLFRKYKDTLDSKERFNVSSNNELRAMGFTDVLEQDGVSISTEYGIPAGVGYGLNMKQMELRSWLDDGELFQVKGPWESPENLGWLVMAIAACQFKFNTPRMFFKLVTLA